MNVLFSKAVLKHVNESRSDCVSFSRGRGPLQWTLGDAQRSNTSEGVKIEPCVTKNHSHSHCSKLTVAFLNASDTGRYSCKYTKEDSDYIASTYVYVEGETLKTLYPPG